MKLTAIKRRFLNFQTLEGVAMVAWGAGFLYCGWEDQRAGYEYAMKSAGVMIVLWGLYKTFVDPVKLKAKMSKMVDEYLDSDSPSAGL